MASAQASAQAAAMAPITIQEFVKQNPLNIEKVLEDFGINSTPIKVAIAHGHEIAFDITYSSIPIEDEAQIGKNVKGLMRLKKFSNEKGIQFSFDMAKVDFGMNIIFSIWLNDKAVPFLPSIEDVIARVAPQTQTVAIFVALTLAYDKMEISMENLLVRSFEYQHNGLPPVRSSKSVILTKALNPPASIIQPTSSIPNFSWKTISSPTPSPALMAPSPVPSLVQIPEDELDESKDESKDEFQGEQEAIIQSAAQADEKSWQTQGRPRKIVGAGPAPVSLSVESTYNGNPIGKQPFGWVQDFRKFWDNGEFGIETNGVRVKVPELDRFRRYTGFVTKFHPKVSGKNPNNPIVLSFMKEALGDHFTRWNQYDWDKIDLKQPFPEENPPMKSS